MSKNTESELTGAARILRALKDTPYQDRTNALAIACRVYCNDLDRQQILGRDEALTPPP